MPSTQRAQDPDSLSRTSKKKGNGLQPFRCSKCSRWWSNFQAYRNHDKRTHNRRGKQQRGVKIKLTSDYIQSEFENRVSQEINTFMPAAENTQSEFETQEYQELKPEATFTREIKNVQTKQSPPLVQQGIGFQIHRRKQSTAITNQTFIQGKGLLQSQTCEKQTITCTAILGITNCVVDKGSEGPTSKTPTIQSAAKLDVTNHVVGQRKLHMSSVDSGGRVNYTNQRTIKNCLVVPLSIAGKTTVVLECKTCTCTFRVSRLKRHKCFRDKSFRMNTVIECKACKCKVAWQRLENHKCAASNGTLNIELQSTARHSNTAPIIPARINCADEVAVDVYAVKNSSLVGPGFAATQDQGKASTMPCQHCDLHFVPFKTNDALHNHTKMHKREAPPINRNSNDSQADAKSEASTTQYKCVPCAMVFSSFIELQKHNCKNTKATKKRKSNSSGFGTKKRRKDVSFECPECEKLFPTKEHLIFHQRLSRPCMIVDRKYMPFKYQCTVCSQKLLTKAELRQYKHRKECTIFVCQYCAFTFKSRSGLQYHTKQLHYGETPYECMQCRIKFSTEEAFDEHRTSHKDEVMVMGIKCQYCDEMFESWKKVSNHEPKHRFKCSECERSDFRSPYTRDVHVREVHMGEKVCACTKCGEKFLQESDLEAHSKAKLKCDRFKCKECNRIFKQKLHLDNHMQVKHNETAERPHRCEKCNKRFILERQLKSHLQQIHPDDTLTEKCHLCQEMFKSKRHLQRHLHRKHKNETLKYKCPHCDQHVSTGLRLDRHVKMFHSGGTYECSECGKSFPDRTELNTHKKNKHRKSTRKHACSTCGKKLESPYKLRIHERIHTGERPYLCLICGKGFTEESQLQSHIRTHEGKKSFLCSACGKGFVHLFSLKSHVKHNHKDIKVSNISGKSRQVNST